MNEPNTTGGNGEAVATSVGLAGGPEWGAFSDGTFRGWGVAIKHPSGDGSYYAPFATGLTEWDARMIAASRELLTYVVRLRNRMAPKTEFSVKDYEEIKALIARATPEPANP